MSPETNPSSFIHASLDDRGLTPAQFRVFCHLARRAGSGEAFAAIESMARVCKLHPDTVRECLRALQSYGMVSREDRSGRTSIYRLSEITQWSRPHELDGGVNTMTTPKRINHTPSKRMDGSPPKAMDTHPPETDGYKVPPFEVTKKEIPFKVIPKVLVFPESLSSETFRQKFDEWITFRKTKRGVSANGWPGFFQKQLTSLSKFSEAEVVEAIENSIFQGYTGIFLKRKSLTEQVTKRTPAEQAALDRKNRDDEERVKQFKATQGALV